VSRAARRRPRQPQLGGYDRGLVHRRLREDERFWSLAGLDRHVLSVAVLVFMGGHGYWWPTRKTWAAAAGVSVKTIGRTTARLEAVGLLTKRPYFRPPGGGHPGANSSAIYRLDPVLVGPKLLAVPAISRDSESSLVSGPTSRDSESSLVSSSASSTSRDCAHPRQAGTRGPRRTESGTEAGQQASAASGAARARVKGARTGREPRGFTALLDGIPLGGVGRSRLLAAWRSEPERIGACVAEWWDRQPTVGPGLLVTMVERGDDPRLWQSADDGVPF
jgi:hypothetical protein